LACMWHPYSFRSSNLKLGPQRVYDAGLGQMRKCLMLFGRRTAIGKLV
jgi:hypothetical protein